MTPHPFILSLLFVLSAQAQYFSFGDQTARPQSPGGTNSRCGPVDTTNLFAWTAFDDLTGTDLSGNGNTVTFTASPTNAPGQITNAVGFNGTSQFGTYANNFADSSALTWTAWVYMPSSGGGALEGRGKDGSGAGWNVIWNVNQGAAGNTATIVTTSGGVTQYSVTGTATLSASAWHFVCLVWTPGTSLAVWTDGVLDNSTTVATTTLRSSGTGIEIGAAPQGGFFNGLIDDPRTYARAIATGEIATIYSHGQSGCP